MHMSVSVSILNLEITINKIKATHILPSYSRLNLIKS